MRAPNSSHWTTVIAIAIAAGVVAGVAEVVVVIARKVMLGDWLWSDSNAIWMTPLSYVLVLLIGAIPLALLARVAERLVRPVLADFLVIAAASVGFLFLFHPALHRVAIVVLAVGIAAQLAPRLARLAPQSVVRLWRGNAFALIVLVAIGLGLGAMERFNERRAVAGLPAAKSGAQNIILIVLDTVRSISLGLYGNANPTSPTLDSLAANGVAFTEAYATAPWTLPSHATMLTGRYPIELDASWTRPLGSEYSTLAEAVTRRGYASAGFVANVAYTGAETGLNRGFLHFDDYGVTLGDLIVASSLGRVLATNPSIRSLIDQYDILGRKDAHSIVDAFLDWQSEQGSRPFFAFLNFYDAHEPYLPAEPFDTMFGSKSGRNFRMIRYLNARMAERSEKESMPAKEGEAWKAAYEGAIREMDGQLGRLFAELAERGLADNTIIAVVSDHGEQFGEHGLYSHGNSLYSPALHVPLILGGRLPIDGPMRIAGPVSLRDLPATLLLLSGNAQFDIPGSPLLPRSATESARLPSAAFSSVEPPPNQHGAFPTSKGPMRSLAFERYLYIRSGDGSEELYDRIADPAESLNLARDARFAGELERARAVVDSIQKSAGSHRRQPSHR